MIKATELPKQSPEFEKVSTNYRFREYMHEKEPGCELKKRIEVGEIVQTRYYNYLYFLQEIQKKKKRAFKKSIL